MTTRRLERRSFLRGAAGLGLAVGCSSNNERRRRRSSDDDDDRDTKQSGSSSSTGTSAVADTKNPWVVGAYLPLTGGDAKYGQDCKSGVDLALEEINASGGAQRRAIKLLYEDDRSSPNEVTTHVQSLIDRDNVIALIGEIASSRSVVGGIIASKKSVPMISPSSTNIEVTRDRKFAFRTCFTDPAQARLAAEYCVKSLKKTKIGIVFAEDDLYSQGLASDFKASLTSAGLTPSLEEKFSQTERNFTPVAALLKSSGCEIVYAPLYYMQMIMLARAASAEGIPASIFLGSDGWSGEERLYTELDGAHYTDHYVPDMPWPRARKLAEAYEAKYGKKPNALAATGYDAMLVLADALKRAKDPTSLALRDAIAETTGFEGATGPITLDKDRNADKAIIIVQIRDKAPRYAAAYGPGAEKIGTK